MTRVGNWIWIRLRSPQVRMRFLLGLLAGLAFGDGERDRTLAENYYGEIREPMWVETLHRYVAGADFVCTMTRSFPEKSLVSPF